MKIDEVLSFKNYSEDSRFKKKIPSHGLIEERGDNIYYYEGGKLCQRVNPFHNDKNMEDDVTNGRKVLISNYYFYFGRNAIDIDPRFLTILKKGKDGKPGPSHKSNFSVTFIEEFIKWVEGNYKPGRQGDPSNFEQQFININKWKKKRCN